MKHALLSLAVIFVLLYTIAPAQEGNSTTRVEKQHKITKFLKEHVKQSEASLLIMIQGTSVVPQRAALQVLREMEQLFPEYPFEASIVPLETILKREASDPVARKLVALALDQLHSEAGDAVIRDVANKSGDKGLQTLCQALLVKDLEHLQ